MSKLNTQDQQICEEIVTQIATLAKLRLTNEESEIYQAYFTELLTLFHELDTLDISYDLISDNTLLNADDCREDMPSTIDLSGIKNASPHFNEKTRYFDVPQFIEYDDE